MSYKVRLKLLVEVFQGLLKGPEKAFEQPFHDLSRPFRYFQIAFEGPFNDLSMTFERFN